MVEEEVLTHTDWFLEIPEELDVCVAQRHFEEALNLLQKAKDYISQHKEKDHHGDHVLIDIERKVIAINTFIIGCLLKHIHYRSISVTCT